MVKNVFINFILCLLFYLFWFLNFFSRWRDLPVQAWVHCGVEAGSSWKASVLKIREENKLDDNILSTKILFIKALGNALIIVYKMSWC